MGLAACFRTFGVAALCLAGSAFAGCTLTGCATVQLQPTQRSVEAQGLARVEVVEVDGDILSFDVYNLSKLTLVVLRDKIVLETPTGRRGREPGGIQRSYEIAPGAMHDVKVKFDFSDCTPGTELKVRFDDALVADGAPLRISPVPFVCR